VKAGSLPANGLALFALAVRWKLRVAHGGRLHE
jgi:hypothetical protein